MVAVAETEASKLKFVCGYCGKDKKPPRIYPTWDDLMDHIINFHRWKIEQNKLVRR